MEYPIKRHCTSFIQPCITISWENFPLFLEKLKNRGLVWLAWVLLLRFTVKCSKMAQGKKNVRVRKSVGVLPYNNAAWDMTIFLHYEHLFVTKNSYKCSPCTKSTLYGLSVLFSRASWHKSANWCASALWSKDLAKDLARQRLREVFLPTSGILIQATERQNVGVYWVPLSQHVFKERLYLSTLISDNSKMGF